MRFKYFIILLILPIHLFCLEISGWVVNKNGEALENVVIIVNDRAEITDRSGAFTLTDLQMNDLVNFHKISFKDVTMSVQNLPHKIVLQPETISIQGLRVIEKRKQKLVSSGETLLIKPQSKTGSAADILREKTNLQVSGIPLAGEEQNIIFPGFKGRHTLIMLDGIPLNKSGTAFDISTIPAEIIESIEIVKESSSSIGGAGSMGGIININTISNNQKLSVQANQKFGSFSLDERSVKVTTGNSRIQLGAFLKKSFAKNDFDYIPADDPDTLRSREYNEKSIYDAALDIKLANKLGILSYKFLFQDFFKKLPGNIESLEWYKNSRLTGRSEKHILKYFKPFKDFNFMADLYYSVDNSLYDNTRLDLPWSNYQTLATLAENHQHSKSIKLHTEYLQDEFYFDWGVNYKYEDFKYKDLHFPEQSIEKVYRNNYALFAETLLQKDHFPYKTSMNGSLRLDRTTDYDDITSWKLAPEFSYENYFTVSLGGNVANGYTIPSYYSLFWKGDTHVSGNPDLFPESSLSWQIYSQIKLNKNRLIFSYQHDDLDNMIIWVIDSFGKWKPMNLSCAEVKNWDLELNIHPTNFLSITTNYKRTKAINKTREDANFNKDLIYIPKYTFNINSKVEFINFYGSVSYILTGEQWTVPDQTTIEHLLPAYDLLNAAIGYNLYVGNFAVRTSFKLNNILNNLYEIYDHIPQPGVNWEMNLKIEWKI